MLCKTKMTIVCYIFLFTIIYMMAGFYLEKILKNISTYGFIFR